MFLYDALINLGVFLLYMPPFIVFVSQYLLIKLRDVIKSWLLLGLSFPLYVMMIMLLPQAWGAFTFYFATFHLFFFVASRIILDNVKAFSLAIYVCFAVSFLWEWPLIISYYGVLYAYNFDSVVMSLFKALGIPFLYLTIWRLGWRPNKEFIGLLVGIIILGRILSTDISYVGWFIHLYRLPWLLLFTLNIMSLRAKDFYKWIETKKI